MAGVGLRGNQDKSVKCGVWRYGVESVKCGVRSVKCGAESVKCGVWSLECEVESVKRGVQSVKYEVWSVKWGVWSVECEVWIEECEVWSVKCGVWRVECQEESVECGVWSVEWRVESVKFWSVEWGGEFEDVWSVKCDVGSVECEVESVMRGVESGECEVWSVSVECGVEIVMRGVESVESGVWLRSDCEVWSVEFEVWSVKWRVCSVECGVESVKCGVGSVEWRVWSVMWEVWSGECKVWSGEREVWSLKFGVWNVECGVWFGKWGVWCGVCGVLLQTVCMLLGFLFSCREPNFCVVSKRNWSGGLASSQICHLLAPLLCSPFFLCGCLGRPLRTGYLGVDVPWSQNCPQCVSILLVLLHLCCLHWSWYFALGPQLGIVSHNLCVSSLRRVFLLSFLRPLWDAGFLVFPIPLSTPVTALGQFSFRQVSPLGSPFVSLLVAALQRGNSYAFHVSNDIIRCPLWPQCYCYWHMSFGSHHWLSRFQYVFCKINFQEARPGAFGSFLFRAPWWTWKFLAFSSIFARGAGFATDGADGTWWVFRDRIGLVAVEVWSATWASVCSCRLIQAQDRAEDEPCFASNMLTCWNQMCFPCH